MAARSPGMILAGGLVPVPPGVPGRAAEADLAGLDDQALAGLVQSLPRASQSVMTTLADVVGGEDPRLDHMLSMRAVAVHWGELPPREQQILIMTFGGGMSQAQIGQRLRISQMHVSRLRARALGHLRARLLGLEPDPLPGPPRRRHPGRHATTTTASAGRLPARRTTPRPDNDEFMNRYILRCRTVPPLSAVASILLSGVNAICVTPPNRPGSASSGNRRRGR
jgi:DNA-binding CsgD family transcriptional regulator